MFFLSIRTNCDLSLCFLASAELPLEALGFGSKQNEIVLTFHRSVTFFCLLAGSSITTLQNSGPWEGAARSHHFERSVSHLGLELDRPQHALWKHRYLWYLVRARRLICSSCSSNLTHPVLGTGPEQHTQRKVSELLSQLILVHLKLHKAVKEVGIFGVRTKGCSGICESNLLKIDPMRNIPLVANGSVLTVISCVHKSHKTQLIH